MYIYGISNKGVSIMIRLIDYLDDRFPVLMACGRWVLVGSLFLLMLGFLLARPLGLA